MADQNFRVKRGLEVGVGATVLTTTATGNIGIGSTNPQTKLDVQGGNGFVRIGEVLSGYNGITLNNGTSSSDYTLISSASDRTLYINRPSGNALNFRSANTDQMVLSSGGNLGINSSSPTSRLDVIGDAKVSGVITATTFSGNATTATFATNAGISTNLKGGLVGNIPYQSAADTTVFLTNGSAGSILQSNGVGNAPSWVSAAPSNALTGLTIRDEGTIVGTANSITQLNFVGNIVSAAATAGIATITFADFVSTAGFATVAGISTNVIGGIASVSQLNVSGVATIGVVTTNNLFVVGIATIPTLTGTNASFGTINVTTGNIVTGVITNAQGTNLNYSGIGTVGSLNIGATQVISSARQLQNIASLDATTTATIESAIANAPNTFTDLQVTGISTFTNGPVLIGSGTSTGTASQRLQVTGGAYVSGNIGIGTTSPSSLLTVQGNTLITGVATVNSNFVVNGNTLYVDANNNRVGILTTSPIQSFQVGAAGTNVFVINSIGNVGVGTTNPLQNLHVLGNLLVAAGSSTAQHITQKAYELNSGTLSWEGSAGQLFSITNNLTSGSIFSVNDVSGIPSIDVNADGTIALAPYGTNENIGVGTTRPTSKLHLAGNGLVVGILTATTFSGTLLGYASTAGISTNLKGGSGGTIVYQSAADTTAFLANGSSGQILQSNGGTNAPTWVPAAPSNAITGLTIRDEGTIVSTANSFSQLNFVGNIVSVAGTGPSGIATITFADFVSTSGTSTSVIGGIGSLSQLQVTGISTFTNGPVIIGAATSTGTASQPLQVTGGAYVSGSVGIGTTNPLGTLQVNSGTSAVVVSAGGSIGIGRTNPTRPLHITKDSASSTTAQIVVEPATGSNAALIQLQNNSASNLNIGLLNSSGAIAAFTGGPSLAGFIGLSSSNPLLFATNNIERVRIFDTGEVGIGTTVLTGTASQPLQVTGGAYVSTRLGIGQTNPTSLLHLGPSNGNTLSHLYLASGNNAYGWRFDTQDFNAGSVPLRIFRRLNGTDTEVITVLNQNGNIGVGTTNPTSRLTVQGDALVSGVVTATTFVGALTGTATTATKLQNARTFEITGDVVASAISFDGTGNVSFAATIQPNSVGLGTDTTGDYVANITGTSNQITVTSGTGESSTPTLSIPNQFTAPQDVTVTRDLQVNRNLNVTGNITIGGTSATIFSQALSIYDPDIVLGYRTDGSGNDVANDNTANHGGIAIASTEGTPLVQLYNVAIGETNPATYKKIMWFKSGSFTGLNTDAWLMNYAVGIGSTQFPVGTRLAAGNVQFTQNDLAVVRNINASGVITATSFSGNASSATFATSAGIATYATSSGIATYATSAGIATYATTAGVSTNVIGGIASVTQLSVSGITTLGVTSATNLTTQQLSVSGLSTFSGIATHTAPIFGTTASFTGVVTALSFIGNTSSATFATSSGVSTSVIGGIGSITQLQVTGVSTFTNGPVLIGSATSTGTASQQLQVTGGAYVSGSVGIGTTNPTSTLTNFGSFATGLTANTLSVTNDGDGIVRMGTTIIGTPTGTSRLNLQDRQGSYLSLYNSTSLVGRLNAPSAADIALEVGGTERLRILGANGNIGIGTTNPTSKLQVQGDVLVSGITTSSRLTLNGANSTADGGGQIYLNGATGNRIDFNINGVAAPTLTTRSVGTKLVLYPAVGATSVDYGFGIETNTLWYSVGDTSRQHRWYAGNTQLADLKGSGELVIGSTSLTGTASQRLQVTGGAYVSGSVGIGTTNPQTSLQVKDALAFETTNTTTTNTNQVAVDTFATATFRSAKYQVQVTCPGQISTLGGITTGGRGYTAGTYNVTFTTSSGNGSAAQGTLVVSNGTVGQISVSAGGTGYVAGDVLTASGGSGLQVSVGSTGASGNITALTLSSAGIGYTSGVGVGTTSLTLLGGSGFNAVGLATIFDGVITSSTLLQQPTTGTGGTVFYSGSNYSTASVLSVTRSDLTNTITTITGSVGVSTFTSLTAHGIGVSDVVRVSSTSNGLTAGTDYYVVTVPSTTTFTLGTSVGVGTTFTTGSSLSIGFFRNSAANGGQVAYTNAITGVSTNFQASDLMVLQNGTTADFIEYATIANNDVLGTFASDISGANARLLFTPTYPDNTVKVARQAITV